MNNFVSWEYYSSHFPKLNESKFNACVYQATVIVRNKLNKDFNDMTPDEQTKVKDCVCMLLNSELYSIGSVSSVSNDGYSESYVNSKELTAQRNRMIDEMLGHLVKRYECF